jgi:hypothetical protein
MTTNNLDFGSVGIRSNNNPFNEIDEFLDINEQGVNKNKDEESSETKPAKQQFSAVSLSVKDLNNDETNSNDLKAINRTSSQKYMFSRYRSSTNPDEILQFANQRSLNQQFFDKIANNIIIEEQSFDVREDNDHSRLKQGPSEMQTRVSQKSHESNPIVQ